MTFFVHGSILSMYILFRSTAYFITILELCTRAKHTIPKIFSIMIHRTLFVCQLSISEFSDGYFLILGLPVEQLPFLLELHRYIRLQRLISTLETFDIRQIRI